METHFNLNAHTLIEFSDPAGIFIAGDSTACFYDDNSHNNPSYRVKQRGWGQYVQDHFDPDYVSVSNQAWPGASSKTFTTVNGGANYRNIFDHIKKGDYLLIQFGHNDGHNPSNPESTDAALPTTSEGSFKWYLNEKYIKPAKAKEAIPILITPVCRRNPQTGGRYPAGSEYDHRDYADAVHALAEETGTALLDMKKMSGDLLDSLSAEKGAAASALLYSVKDSGETDMTHFSEYGAKAICALVLDGIIWNNKPVLNALSILKRDIIKTLEAPEAADANRIVIVPHDEAIPEEGWTIEVTMDKMTVRAADSLGCVYALLFISETFLGVTPFWFWNDQIFTKRPSAPVPSGIYHSPHYAVRFRGWFVNDEVLIDNWDAGPENTEHWRMVFEALLRCGGNMVIPGTDSNSRKYSTPAADMGLWITHHHSQPLGAEMFLRAYPDEIPSYSANGALFERLWEQAVIEQKQCKVIWALGFRGQGDYPFWENDPSCVTAQQRGELISGIINRQYEIIKRHRDDPVCCVNLYYENTELYRKGTLRLPSGVIKVWSDNGYGRMVSRRQRNDNPRIHALPAPSDTGPHGIYYHCSFHDLQASNHLTMPPNSAEFLAAELKKSLAAKAGEFWIVNCGSLKPHVHLMDLVSAMWRTGQIEVCAWRLRYSKTYYGEKNAESIAALFGEYASCTAKYGPCEDDRAGEQIWHHPVRELLCRWMSGDTKSCVESLVWLAGNVPFCGQVKRLEEIAGETLPRWEVFCEKCAALLPELDAESHRLFRDTILLQARLQLSGAAGALAFCESFHAYASGEPAAAFRLADISRSRYEDGVKALSEAEHGKWTGYYQGDCLTDVRLTASCLGALVSWLRIIGDGPDFHKWERDFLTPAPEKRIMLLSSKRRPLDNRNLAERLERIPVQNE
jgi:lysophospholipase L1-like esterase